MNTDRDELDEPLQTLKKALRQDGASLAAETLARHPALKQRINEPFMDFDAPPIMSVRSRAMLDVLLAAGADINAKSTWWAGGFGLLHCAKPGLAHYAIEKGAVVDAHAAAHLGLMERLQELLTEDPSLVHARGGDGQTPLHFASTPAIAEYLLSRGADIDARDIDHESTPAQYMLRERNAVARYLVQRGCHTDILMAAAVGDAERVRGHLDADPGCIRTSVSGKWFPMRNPQAGGHIYIWTLGHNKTAHDAAREHGHEEVSRLLMERTPEELRLALAGAQGDEAAFSALLAKRPGLVQELSPSELGKLVDAAVANRTQAVRLMLSAGWPVDARGDHGGTALHWAAFHGNAEMAKVILHHRPPLEENDSEFHSPPMGWAVHGSEHGWHCRTGNYASVVEALIQAGAKLPAKLGGSEPVKEVLRRHGVNSS